MQEVRFRKGERIFSEGDPSDHCFKIISGKVEILLAMKGLMKRGRTETVATCGPGDMLGEMSVIDGGRRSASAVAVEPTVCTAYTAEEILHVLTSDPNEALAYVRMLINRLRRTNRKISWGSRNMG